MQKTSFKFYWEETLIEMLPSRALFLPETKELLICDIHLGKAEYFQQNGIPLTNNSDENNFTRIKKLKLIINKTKTPSPFAFPLLVERLKNTLSNEPIEKRVEKLIKKYSI